MKIKFTAKSSSKILVLFAVVILSVVVILVTIFVSLYKDPIHVEKGIGWLIKEQESLSPNPNGTGLRLIYKVTKNRQLARRLSELVNKGDRLEIINPTIIDDTDDIQTNWSEIEDVARRLFKEQCAGKDVSLEVVKLEKIYNQSKDRMRKAIKQSPTPVITTLYFLGKLGISDEILLDEVFETLRSGGGDSIQELYGLTHIIFVKSDYLDRYLNPDDYKKEIEIFERVLSEYAKSEEMGLGQADILSEIIISMKLLGKGRSNDIDLIKQSLIKMQNNDGSWGGDRHATIVATLALMDFTSNLRETNGYCAPGYKD